MSNGELAGAPAAAPADVERRRRLMALGAAGGFFGFAAATGALWVWPGATTAVALAGFLLVPFWVAWRAEPEAEMAPEVKAPTGAAGPGEEPDRAVNKPHSNQDKALQWRRIAPDEDGPHIIGWIWPPEAQTALVTNVRSEALEALARQDLKKQGPLHCALDVAVREPRRYRGIGRLRIMEWTFTVAFAGEGDDAGRARVVGRWALDWLRHPVAGRSEGVGGRSEGLFEEIGTFACDLRPDAQGGLVVEGLESRSELFESIIPWVGIPAGSFLMGSAADDQEAYDDEKPQHEAQVVAFHLGATTVTNAQYGAVVGKQVAVSEANLPVTGVSWDDAIDFCNALSLLAGRRPCYARAKDGVTWDRMADGFRLPDEEEWEYACRAGTTSRYSFGNDERLLTEYAWLGETPNAKAHAVALKLPNHWGIYDMHGNVWERVWDEQRPYTDKVTSDNTKTKVVNDKSPPDGGRVVRGGSFWYEPWGLRSASRYRFGSGVRFRYVGFRCAVAVLRPLDPLPH